MKSNENRKTNRNQKNRNRNRSIVTLFVLCTMLAATLVGCQNTVADNTEPAISEEVSEPVSQAESEEVSEVESEEVDSEDTSEDEIDLSLYTNANGKKAVDLAADMDYDEFKIIVWRRDVGAKAILSNGESYKLQDKDDLLVLYFPDEMLNVQSNEYGEISGENEDSCRFSVIGCGENIEVTFTGTDVDGKEHAITIYVTKDWKYEWE